MNTKLKTQLVAIAAASLGLAAYGCGGGDAEAGGDTGGEEATGGGEASCSGAGEASCSGAGEASCSGATEEGGDMGAEGDEAGSEAS